MIKTATVRELRVGDYIRFKLPWNGTTCEGKITEFHHEPVYAGGCRLYGLSLKTEIGQKTLTLLGNTPVEIISNEKINE